jgi:hypothetical protein
MEYFTNQSPPKGEVVIELQFDATLISRF